MGRGTIQLSKPPCASFSVLSLSLLPYCQLGMEDGRGWPLYRERKERNATRTREARIRRVLKLFTTSKVSLSESTKIQSPKLHPNPRFCSFPKFSPTESFSFLSNNSKSENVTHQHSHSSAPYKLPVKSDLLLLHLQFSTPSLLLLLISHHLAWR